MNYNNFAQSTTVAVSIGSPVMMKYMCVCFGCETEKMVTIFTSLCRDDGHWLTELTTDHIFVSNSTLQTGYQVTLLLIKQDGVHFGFLNLWWTVPSSSPWFV